MKPEEFKRRMDKVYHDALDKLKIEVANNFKSLPILVLHDDGRQTDLKEMYIKNKCDKLPLGTQSELLQSIRMMSTHPRTTYQDFVKIMKTLE